MIPRSLSVSNKSTLFNRNIQASVVSILKNPRHDWKKISCGGNRLAHSIEVNWKKFNLNDYLFTHATIVSSVETEANGYYIKPICSPIVNLNGNAWTNPVLLATFRTFVGGYNYLEHVQIPSQSKGTILDAVLRPFQYRDDKGNVANVFICDILVATSRCHWDLIQQIQSGRMNTLSMGTVCSEVTCSKCGRIFSDDEESCDHIKYELGSTFIDENGIERIVAELCGSVHWDDVKKEWVGNPDSNTFIEASWVMNPAFIGAVVNHFVNPNKVDPSLFREASLEEEVANLFRVRVADRYGKTALEILRREKYIKQRNDMISKIIKGA